MVNCACAYSQSESVKTFYNKNDYGYYIFNLEIKAFKVNSTVIVPGINRLRTMNRPFLDLHDQIHFACISLV